MQSEEFTDDDMLIAQEEGKQSFSSGFALDQCPYKDARSERWRQGFRAAEAKFLDVSQSRGSARKKASSDNLILRLWRGEEGLAKTYWLYGVLFPLLASFAVQAAMMVTSTDTPEAQAIVGYAWLAYIIFISVAIWRSATANGAITFWGIVARCIVVGVPVIGFLAAILLPIWHDPTQAATQLTEPSSYSAPATGPVAPADEDALHAAKYAINRFPFLDSESPSANQAAINETIELRDRFIKEGYSPGTAIRIAAEITGPKYAQ